MEGAEMTETVLNLADKESIVELMERHSIKTNISGL
jgi:hypothetical protein